MINTKKLDETKATPHPQIGLHDKLKVEKWFYGPRSFVSAKVKMFEKAQNLLFLTLLEPKRFVASALSCFIQRNLLIWLFFMLLKMHFLFTAIFIFLNMEGYEGLHRPVGKVLCLWNVSQNNTDSSWWTISKFVWQLDWYKPWTFILLKSSKLGSFEIKLLEKKFSKRELNRWISKFASWQSQQK